MKAYRQWLSPKSYEAMASLGGSFYSDDITDYYLTPYDLGYGPFVKFDHDFVGTSRPRENRRHTEAEESHAGLERRRYRPCLRVACSMPTEISPNTSICPWPTIRRLPYDKVLKDGKTVGLSTYTGYTYNERAMVSLAIVDVEHSEPGTEVTLVWGEEGRGSSKPTVERHAQMEIRATVAPVPIAEVARVAYRPKPASA